MKITLANRKKVDQLICVFKNLKQLCENINLHVSEERVYSQGMDMSHVNLFEINISKNWFDYYENDNDVVLGLNCEIMHKVINCIEEDQSISFIYDGGDKLEIVFEGESAIQREFNIPLIEIDDEFLDIPEKEDQVDIIMDSPVFSLLIDQVSMFGETMTLNCNEEQIKLSSIGDLGSMTADIKEKDIIEYCIDEEVDSLKSSFPIKYLKKICLFCKINKQIKIHFSTSAPLKIVFMLCDDEDIMNPIENNKISFYLAPIIED